MLIKYIIENKIKLLRNYLIGTTLLFCTFYLLSSIKGPTYRSNFSLQSKGSVTSISHSLENLFNLIMTQDTVTFSHLMKMDMRQIARINSAEFDLLNGNILEITLVSKDTGIIMPFYKSLITYINSDTYLNNEIMFSKKLIENEMELVESELKTLSNNKGEPDSINWQLSMAKSGVSPSIGSSNTLKRIYLVSMLNDLSLKHFNLVSVEALNKPVIPLKSEKASKKIYLIFSNIIVISLLFIQYLIAMNKPKESID